MNGSVCTELKKEETLAPVQFNLIKPSFLAKMVNI